LLGFIALSRLCCSKAICFNSSPITNCNHAILAIKAKETIITNAIHIFILFLLVISLFFSSVLKFSFFISFLYFLFCLASTFFFNLCIFSPLLFSFFFNLLISILSNLGFILSFLLFSFLYFVFFILFQSFLIL